MFCAIMFQLIIVLVLNFSFFLILFGGFYVCFEIGFWCFWDGVE